MKARLIVVISIFTQRHISDDHFWLHVAYCTIRQAA